MVFFVLLLYELPRMVTTLGHVVLGNLNPCSQTTVTHTWPQDRRSHIPFEERAVGVHPEAGAEVKAETAAPLPSDVHPASQGQALP